MHWRATPFVVMREPNDLQRQRRPTRRLQPDEEQDVTLPAKVLVQHARLFLVCATPACTRHDLTKMLINEFGKLGQEVPTGQVGRQL